MKHRVMRGAIFIVYLVLATVGYRGLTSETNTVLQVGGIALLVCATVFLEWAWRRTEPKTPES